MHVTIVKHAVSKDFIEIFNIFYIVTVCRLKVFIVLTFWAEKSIFPE